MITLAPEERAAPGLDELFAALKAGSRRMTATTAKDRRAILGKLAAAIESRRDAIAEAIHADLARPVFETEIAETQHALGEIDFAQHHLEEWMRGERADASMLLAGTSCHIRYEPKGVALIMAPWNYPFDLVITPLVAALAAGNSALVKPSEKTPHVAEVLRELIAACLDPEVATCVTGGPDVAAALLDLPFDHIFFTGSTAIGRAVMTAAAKHLASVTLELGGKSPAVVDRHADIRAAAERITWGKFFNAGQTCIAPDYVLVDATREREFLDAAKAAVARSFGTTDDARAASTDLARIVDDGHFARLRALIEESVRAGARLEAGGQYDAATRYIAPTILSGVRADMPVMQAEIFGPILPVMPVNTIGDAIAFINQGDKPLALYVFAPREVADRVVAETSSGAAVIGGTLLQYGIHTLPFGGIGASGQGSYHGIHGFRAFSHARAVVRQREPALVRFFFPPYRGRMHALARRMLRWIG